MICPCSSEWCLDYLILIQSYYLIHLFHLLRCLNPALLHPTVISWAKAALLSSALLNPPFNDSFPSVVAFIHSAAFYRPSLAPHPASTASSRFARSNYMTLSTSAGAHAIPTIYGCLSISTAVYNVQELFFTHLRNSHCLQVLITGQFDDPNQVTPVLTLSTIHSRLNTWILKDTVTLYQGFMPPKASIYDPVNNCNSSL